MLIPDVAALPFVLLVVNGFPSPVAQPVREPIDGTTAETMDVYRLPGHTVPVSYALNLTPDYGRRPDAVDFDGEVRMVIAAKRRTSRLTLNYRDLAVCVAYVHDRLTRDDFGVIDIRYEARNEQVHIVLDTDLRADREYVVIIEYRVTIREGMDGFYRSAYDGPDGAQRWLFLTFFNPTGARKIFPCYDEPEYKTPFQISVTRPQNKFVRSNMPNSTSYYDKSVQAMRDVFKVTPPMSTHMVAIIVSGLEGTESGGRIGESTYAFTRPEYSDQIQYVSSKASDFLRAMEDFTQLQFELPKLDMFAVPNLKSDAMGNWGLTTYREKFLLLNDVSSKKAKEIALSTIGRQTAHQWFGNLVTCSWWDYLWLHDAFATYLQYFITHSIHPDWKMNETFVIEQHQSALAYDQSPRRPITASVRTPDEINSVFYDQTYEKAAAFLRMLKYATNDDIFQQSLARYLRENSYGAVSPDALFVAFEETLSQRHYDFGLGQGVTVTDFMKKWTEQAGYPVVNVVKTDDMFVMTQERFLVDTPDRINDPAKWYVGITYTTEANMDFENLKLATWFMPKMEKCTVPASRSPGWFIVNLQSTGFYRVNYDTDNWLSLANQLKVNHTVIHNLNRAQLVDDSFNLARAGKLHYSIPLKLSSYLEKEDNVLPWYSAINGYSYLIERMRRNDTEYATLKECVNALSGIIYRKIEKLVVIQSKTDHVTLTSWNALSTWACGLDNTMCKDSALAYYKKWQNGEKIPPDIRDAAFCIGIKVTNKTSTWNQMLDLYKTTSSPSEKRSAQSSLACSENHALLSRYLLYILERDDGPIREQDYKDVIISVSSTPNGLNVLIDFLVNNLAYITKNIFEGDALASFIYATCASKAALDSEILRIRNLKEDSSISENLRASFNDSYRQVEYNIYWYEKYHNIISQNAACKQEFTTEDTQLTDKTEISTQRYTATITEESTEYKDSTRSTMYQYTKPTTKYSSKFTEDKTSSEKWKSTTPFMKMTENSTQSTVTRSSTLRPKTSDYISSSITPHFPTNSSTSKSADHSTTIFEHTSFTSSEFTTTSNTYLESTTPFPFLNCSPLFYYVVILFCFLIILLFFITLLFVCKSTTNNMIVFPSNITLKGL